MARMTARQEAEAIEQFGDDLAKLLKRLDDVRLSPWAMERFNAIENVEHLDDIAKAARQLGEDLGRECDQVEEVEDRRRDNPLMPDFRRLGQ